MRSPIVAAAVDGGSRSRYRAFYGNRHAQHRRTELLPGGSSWKFPLLLAVVLMGIFFWKQNESATQQAASRATPVAWTPSAVPSGEVVRLEIDFGNGAIRQFDSLPHKPEMTVADVLAAARDFRPGISFTQIGEGAGGFLTSLDGLKNEGASGRNWRYEVAGTPGSMSFCLQKVAPGELVRWSFAGESEDR